MGETRNRSVFFQTKIISVLNERRIGESAPAEDSIEEIKHKVNALYDRYLDAQHTYSNNSELRKIDTFLLFFSFIKLAQKLDHSSNPNRFNDSHPYYLKAKLIAGYIDPAWDHDLELVKTIIKEIRFKDVHMITYERVNYQSAEKLLSLVQTIFTKISAGELSAQDIHNEIADFFTAQTEDFYLMPVEEHAGSFLQNALHAAALLFKNYRSTSPVMVR